MLGKEKTPTSAGKSISNETWFARTSVATRCILAIGFDVAVIGTQAFIDI